MCMLPACMPAHHMCCWYPQKSEEGVRSCGTELRDHCQHPCGCQELNLRPLEEQKLGLTTEPSLYPPLGKSIETYSRSVVLSAS